MQFLSDQYRLVVDVWRLIVMDWPSLIKGYALGVVIVFPLTFVPTLIKHGFKGYQFLVQAPYSFAFSSFIAVISVFAALLHNYNKLVDQQRVFKTPAFEALPFEGMVSGLNSVIEDISTFVIGEIDGYFYRIELISFIKAPYVITVVPLIAVDNHPEVVKILIHQEKFILERYLYQSLKLTHEQLNNTNYLISHLKHLSKRLSALDVAPLQLSSQSLK